MKDVLTVFINELSPWNTKKVPVAHCLAPSKSVVALVFDGVLSAANS